jgi:hypothetical protein
MIDRSIDRWGGIVRASSHCLNPNSVPSHLPSPPVSCFHVWPCDHSTSLQSKGLSKIQIWPHHSLGPESEHLTNAWGSKVIQGNLKRWGLQPMLPSALGMCSSLASQAWHRICPSWLLVSSCFLVALICLQSLLLCSAGYMGLRLRAAPSLGHPPSVRHLLLQALGAWEVRSGRKKIRTRSLGHGEVVVRARFLYWKSDFHTWWKWKQ